MLILRLMITALVFIELFHGGHSCPQKTFYLLNDDEDDDDDDDDDDASIHLI